MIVSGGFDQGNSYAYLFSLELTFPARVLQRKHTLDRRSYLSMLVRGSSVVLDTYNQVLALPFVINCQVTYHPPSP